MYFVILESTVPKSRTAISAAYYTNMQKLLHAQPGFISEVPFGSPFDEERQTLVSKWVDGSSVRKWRLQHDHLKIEKKGRETVFGDYRLRAGPKLLSDGEEDEGNEMTSTHKQGHFMVLYEQPIAGIMTPLSHEITALLDDAKFDVSAVTTRLIDVAVHQGEQTALWVSGWPTKAAAVEFESSLRRVPGDEIHIIRVARDYGKNDRAEAPEGADEAQAAAALEDEDALTPA